MISTNWLIKNGRILFLALWLFSATKELYSGQVCDLLASPYFPPTPYSNAYLKFDGKGDYLKTNDINALEFDTATTSSFTIETRFKVDKPFSPQFITGKSFAKGWIIGYHTSEWGFISMTFGSSWKNLYYLGGDTSWHDYRITYEKNGKILKAYVDGVLQFTYTDFVYGAIENGAAFSVGNVGFYPNYGPESINLSARWFKGSMDFIRILVNSSSIINCDFNECSGQFAKDSASYYINDRTLPGEQSCGSVHMMLGFYPCQDTCDPEWVNDDFESETEFISIGSGLKSVTGAGLNMITTSSFSTGMGKWNGKLVACGKFNMAGNTPVNNIAIWNGSSWSSIGEGFNYEPSDIKEYKGELYATGFFDSAIGFAKTKYIAKWNGNSWEPLGIGLGNIGTTMEVFNNELIVGGFFISAGETYSPSIARWNGTEWLPMAQGMTGPVYAICVYNGELYAGGNFIYASGNMCNGIAKWNGTQWVSVGTGIYGGEKSVKTLKVFNGELYAGGSFVYMNGILCSNIAKYDGTRWANLGNGAKGYGCTNSSGYIYDMEVFNSNLYAVGMFTKIGDVSANKIAKWNGSDWCSVEYGIDLLPRALETYDGALFISGDFYSVSGKNYSNIVKYFPKVLTGTVSNNEIPTGIELKQNYPNPFNPETKIAYTVKSPSSDVRLIVYDIRGREVSMPVNRVHNQGGYEISFKGESLAAGVYFYTLIVNGSVIDTKKMLLVK